MRLHARQLRLQTHTQDMEHFVLFHVNIGYVNASHCYITRKLPVLSKYTHVVTFYQTVILMYIFQICSTVIS